MAVTPGDALFDFTNQTPPLALWFAKFEARFQRMATEKDCKCYRNVTENL